VVLYFFENFGQDVHASTVGIVGCGRIGQVSRMWVYMSIFIFIFTSIYFILALSAAASLARCPDGGRVLLLLVSLLLSCGRMGLVSRMWVYRDEYPVFRPRSRPEPKLNPHRQSRGASRPLAVVSSILAPGKLNPKPQTLNPTITPNHVGVGRFRLGLGWV